MNESVLNAIFHGRLFPWEGKPVTTPTQQDLTRKLELERNHFEETMSPYERGRFDQYHCLLEEHATQEIGSAEFDLFMLGIAVGIDIMEYKQTLATPLPHDNT